MGCRPADGEESKGPRAHHRGIADDRQDVRSCPRLARSEASDERGDAPLASMAALLLLAGCAAPLSVEQLSPQAAYRRLERSALAENALSETTRTTLRRHGLLEAPAPRAGRDHRGAARAGRGQAGGVVRTLRPGRDKLSPRPRDQVAKQLSRGRHLRLRLSLPGPRIGGPARSLRPAPAPSSRPLQPGAHRGVQPREWRPGDVPLRPLPAALRHDRHRGRREQLQLGRPGTDLLPAHDHLGGEGPAEPVPEAGHRRAHGSQRRAAACAGAGHPDRAAAAHTEHGTARNPAGATATRRWRAARHPRHPHHLRRRHGADRRAARAAGVRSNRGARLQPRRVAGMEQRVPRLRARRPASRATRTRGSPRWSRIGAAACRWC